MVSNEKQAPDLALGGAGAVVLRCRTLYLVPVQGPPSVQGLSAYLVLSTGCTPPNKSQVLHQTGSKHGVVWISRVREDRYMFRYGV